MPSTYTASLRLEDQANGENSTTWGDKTDTNFALVEQAIAGRVTVSVAGAGDTTLTASNAASDQSRNAVVEFTGVVTGNANVIVPTQPKKWTIFNNTSGAFTRTVKTAAGTGILVPQGKAMQLRCDGTNVVPDDDTMNSLDVVNVLTARGAIDESLAASVAAAATTNIWATTGNTIHVTGAGGPITSFGTAARAGARRTVVFDSTPTVNNGANLILPTGANITMAAGDSMVVLAETTTQFRVIEVSRADGSALTVPATITGAKTFSGAVTFQQPTIFQSTDAGAGEIIGIDLDRFSATPAANDLLMALRWLSRDGGGGTDVAAKLLAKLLDPTAGSEDAELELHTVVAGALAKRATVGQGVYVGAPTGSDKGVGTLNATAVYDDGVLLTGTPYATKSALYTVVATDHDGVIQWTTAGVTVSLTAAATLGAGFRVTLVNAAAAGDLTIDPNGAETLDGLATRLMRPGDRITIYTDGSNWFTIDGCYSYDTGVVSLAAKVGTVDTLAHGLGRAPNQFFARMIATNATTEQGYTQNDEVYVGPFAGDFGSAGGYGVNLVVDATNITAVWGGTGLMPLFNKSTGVEFVPTPGKWSWRLIARERFG